MVVDALAALGIAANILQFIDFAGKLVSKTTRYYRSVDGTLVEHAELNAVAQNLSTLSRGLRSSMREEKYLIGDDQYTSAEQGLWDANRECHNISIELADVLGTLKASDKHRKWQSIWQALRSIWNEEHVERLSNRLAHAREQLMTHLLVHMSSRQALDRDLKITFNTAIEKNILDAIQQSSRSLKNEVRNLSRSLKTASAKEQAHVVVDWQANHRQDLLELSGDLFVVTENAHIIETHEKLLSSLYFTRLVERHDRIPEAHERTFGWIFGGVRDDGTRWDNFAIWLEGRQAQKSLFWVSGKAGSGKSTLMRFLNDRVSTKTCLQKWTGDKNLVMASCFFWKAGTSIQKSLSGMLRSLLHQLLDQDRTFIAEIDPLRWRSLYWGTSNLEDWTDVELRKAMHKLVEVASPKSRFAIFVDGLDEFEGDDLQMQTFIDFLHTLADHNAVKVCVSSRPWNIFLDAFTDCPTLRLEMLTEQDIKLYIQDNLDRSPRFSQLSKVDSTGCLSLVSDVVEKATGVFLWVYLVVRELVKALRNGHNLRMLRKRLDQLPVDLDAFFHEMIDSIELSDRSTASKVFQIFLAQPTMTTLMTLSFVNEDADDFSLELPPGKTRLAHVTDTNDSMLRRINSLCMGLLEVQVPKRQLELRSTWHWKVEYLHRTVQDFLLSDRSQSTLRSYTDGEYDTRRYLCNSWLSQMILVSRLGRTETTIDAKGTLFWSSLESFLQNVEDVEGKQGNSPSALLSKAEAVLLDQLPTVIIGPAVGINIENRVWESVHEWETWNCSFLSLTLQYNIKGYYSALPRSFSRTSRKGRPMLDFALRRFISDQSQKLPPNPDLIKGMLADGADPTEVFEDASIWEHYLATMVRQHRGPEKTDDSSHTNFSETEEQKWYRTTKVLIAYGALYGKSHTHDHEDVDDALALVFGEAVAKRLLNTSVKDSVRRYHRNKRDKSHQQSTSLRSRLLPWKAKGDRK